MTEFINNREDGQLWVATDHEKIIGSIAICKSGPSDAQLRWFLVDPQFHGQGNRLMTTALDFCKAQGYNHIFLWTADPLKAARHLYKKYGFIHEEDEPNYEWTGALITEEHWNLYCPDDVKGVPSLML